MQQSAPHKWSYEKEVRCMRELVEEFVITAKETENLNIKLKQQPISSRESANCVLCA